MPLEIKSILFNYSELREALLRHGAMLDEHFKSHLSKGRLTNAAILSNLSFPPGFISGHEFHRLLEGVSEPCAIFRSTAQNVVGKITASSVALPVTEVREILIAEARHRSIRMPRDATKEVVEKFLMIGLSFSWATGSSVLILDDD